MHTEAKFIFNVLYGEYNSQMNVNITYIKSENLRTDCIIKVKMFFYCFLGKILYYHTTGKKRGFQHVF